jgi:hypothetical protein
MGFNEDGLMKTKLFLGLLILVAGVLFTINYLAHITKEVTDKVSDNALSKLLAISDKPITPEAKSQKPATDSKPSVVEQVMPLVKQVTDSIDKQLPPNKLPIATIKIYDKKNATETTIETPTQLQAQNKTLSNEQLDEQQDKAKKFQAYYKKPEHCISPSTHELRVQCGNDYMRAKIKFEQQYQQEKAK